MASNEDERIASIYKYLVVRAPLPFSSHYVTRLCLSLSLHAFS